VTPTGVPPPGCWYLVQSEAHRVKIAPGVDRAIHATGLLGRLIYASVPAIISSGTGDWRSRGIWDAIPTPVSHTGPASSKSTLAGLMFVVYEAAPMNLAKCRRQANGNAQNAR
jgi:hypothetical protein